MFRIIKIAVIFVFITGGLAQASNSRYILNSLDKCSVQNECADVLDSVRKIQNTSESEVLNLENMLDIKSSVPQYKIPQEAYEYPTEHLYSKSSIDISIIDPKKGDTGVNENYPGLRGANQLVIYTPGFGLRTGTNEFGAEAVVLKNTVVKLSGADSLIPKDGFVISGHGRAKAWILNNIILGSKIYVDLENMKVYTFVTPETYIFEAKEKIKETSNVMQYYRMMDTSYDGRRASNYLAKSNDFIRKAERNPNKAEHYLKQAKEYVEASLQYAIPYKPDEFKGIWIRPIECGEKEIAKTVERIKESGIKNVFLETYYHGTTIYPSEVLKKYGITSQRNEFKGFDPLKIWIKECHKNDIKVHIWFECFYVGNKPPRSSIRHILSVYPQWANTTKNLAESSEIASSGAEHNGYFLDPANPEVQNFVFEILTEIVEKYQPDGINLDYIRYPQCAVLKWDSATATEWGYTKVAREEFQSKFGIDPLLLKFSDPLRQDWFEYRQNKITEFVIKAKNLACKNNIMLTTVVFPDRKRTLETKMQDWKSWSEKNLVDGFTPLLLTTDRRTAGTLLHNMKMEMTSHTKLYPGIFVMFMGGSENELLMQIHETRKMRTNGIIFFDYAHLKNKYIEALTVRVFNTRN